MENQITLSKLKEPFEMVRWKVQSNLPNNKCLCVAYVDSRQVQERLDAVCGPGGWQDDYKEVNGHIYAGIGILINREWVWKHDVGTEANTEKEKSEASDSFKRAAVKWGIGRFLYSLPTETINTKNYKDKQKPCNKDGKILWSGDELTEYVNKIKSFRKDK